MKKNEQTNIEYHYYMELITTHDDEEVMWANRFPQQDGARGFIPRGLRKSLYIKNGLA
jgi:hypothetical protein